MTLTAKSGGDTLNMHIAKILEKINKILTNILVKNPSFTGSITIHFCLGGITGIKLEKNIKP